MSEENQEVAEPYTVESLAQALNLFAEANYMYAQKVDSRLESLDRLHAKMAMSVMEMSVLLESLVHEVMYNSDKTEDEQVRFNERLRKMQNDALENLREMTSHATGSEEDTEDG